MLKLRILFLMSLVYQINFGQSLTNEKLDSLIATTISKYDIPSMVAAIVKKDTVFYGIKGLTRIDTTKTVKLTDKYHIGSNSKAFTSFLAFQAIEKGKIKLDTKFFDLFPDIQDSNVAYKSMTLSDLLSHNALVRPYTSGIEFKLLPKFEGSISDKRLEFAKFILKQKPVKKNEYSNAGYVLAAMMLEKVYNQTFEAALKDAMNKMGIEVFFGFPNKQDINYPWGHWYEKNKQIPLSPDHFYMLEDYMLPAGDISINILDYSKFIQNHLKGILGDASTLKQESYEIICFGLDEYSYGWGNQIDNDEKLAYHDGSAGTFYSQAIISPTHEYAVIIIMNCADDKQVEGLYELSTELAQLQE